MKDKINKYYGQASGSYPLCVVQLCPCSKDRKSPACSAVFAGGDVVCVSLLKHLKRLKQDAYIGIVTRANEMTGQAGSQPG